MQLPPGWSEAPLWLSPGPLYGDLEEYLPVEVNDITERIVRLRLVIGPLQKARRHDEATVLIAELLALLDEHILNARMELEWQLTHNKTLEF